MKLKCAVIVFPGSTGANDIKSACEFFEWKTDLIWHKDGLKCNYDVIFLPQGRPYANFDYVGEDVFEISNAMRKIPYTKTLVAGFSDGFQMLCKVDYLNGHLEKNINNEKITGFKEFSFIDSDILLPISTACGNFIKHNDFNHDVILKYSDSKVSDNMIAGVYDYENKVVGMVACPELAVLPKLRQIDGRKVFEFIKNVI